MGLGKPGTGGIYMLTPTTTSFTVAEFYDMDAAPTSRTRSLASAPAYGEGMSYSIASNSVITYSGTPDPLTGKPSGLGVIGTNAQRGTYRQSIRPQL
ncbi:hypothetical protein Runsl_5322 [Runella slithyformis DSM 19594]|uniref:Uncharacterized protein n=1 Tax=Runella slithyformis (strain ATCC 29530 / DSM 19594 / LMG 11500 / NCIMB 11436 / LSU 4) TaxID=761193 RepID=A0A7U4E8E2_RUNSL|nr:hypothetical protein Runsl_5322 [Runella slithyformis DSM 19594]